MQPPVLSRWRQMLSFQIRRNLVKHRWRLLRWLRAMVILPAKWLLILGAWWPSWKIQCLAPAAQQPWRWGSVVQWLLQMLSGIVMLELKIDHQRNCIWEMCLLIRHPKVHVDTCLPPISAARFQRTTLQHFLATMAMMTLRVTWIWRSGSWVMDFSPGAHFRYAAYPLRNTQHWACSLPCYDVYYWKGSSR